MLNKIKPVISSSNKLKCIIYKSRMQPAYNNAMCFENISKNAFYSNRKLNITGELIINHVESSVIQILEGDEISLDNLFEKIKKDNRHANIITLCNNFIKKRNYSKWVIKKTTHIKTKTDISDYKMLGVIGTGSSGNVTLVQNIIDGRHYALKSIAKNKTKIKTILNEREVLKQLKNTNFIVNLHSCFQDPLNVYFLIDYAEKGDMYSCLKQFDMFPPDITQFYMVQVIEAISILHSKNIIHRDLKLENILIGKDGYIMIADFGLSIHKNNDMIGGVKGTPVYFSPELINDKVIGLFNDIWALGILFHEFVTGDNPYKCHPRNIKEINYLINNTNFSLQDPDEHQFMSFLLNKNYIERPEINDIFNHEYFNNTDITSIINKTEFPPYIPNDVKINNWSIDSLSIF